MATTDATQKKAAPPPITSKLHPGLRALFGGLAASGACCFSHPFETAKTRLQLEGELAKKGNYTRRYKGPLHAVYTVIKNEGILGLYKGFAPGVIYQVCMNSLRLGTYDVMLQAYTNKTGHPFSFGADVVASSFAGTFSGFMASPLFFIKTRLQAQCHRDAVVGTQHADEGMWHGFKSIYAKEGGIIGLWRGSMGGVIRLSVGSMAQLTSYSQSKIFVKSHFPSVEEGLPLHFGASLLASVVVSYVMNPFDMISVRLYNQPVDHNRKGLLYKGFGDAALKIAKTEGVFGFWKGVGALYLRLAPHTIVTFMLWEQLRSLFLRIQE